MCYRTPLRFRALKILVKVSMQLSGRLAIYTRTSDVCACVRVCVFEVKRQVSGEHSVA